MTSSSKQSDLLGKRNPEDDLETKQFLKKLKEASEEKEAAVTKKTLFMGHLPRKTKISDIIDFFKDVVQVVRVRLFVTAKHIHVCCGLVEFSSANEAKKALEKKNGEYLLDNRIHLRVHKKNPNLQRPKFYIDHKVCYKDYLRRESLPIEENEAVKGLDETSDFVEEVLFVANISPQTKILHIKDFFQDVGEVVRVRLIVNHEGKHVGYGFVDFASANEAMKALEKKNGEYLHDHKIFLEVAKTAPPPPKYNLAEKLCYEDYLRRNNLLIEEDGTAVEGLDETPNFVEAVALRRKTLFVSRLSREADISHIINFFKDVGEVVHVRLIVDYTGKHVGDGFVEFASVNEAETALEKMNGEYLHDHKIFLDAATKAPYPLRPKYCIDHKVWYEDYLRRESLLIEEDEAVEGLDEIPDYIEEVAARRKTLFIANISCETRIPKLVRFFNNVGRVVLLGLIVDHRGEDVGCGFVEFVSSKEAEEVLRVIHDKEFCLEVAEIAPYPLRPKYNLAEKIWWQIESLLIEEGQEDEEDEEEEDDDLETIPNLKKLEVPMLGVFCAKKFIFSYDD